jgi:hypothetical protein
MRIGTVAGVAVPVVLAPRDDGWATRGAGWARRDVAVEDPHPAAVIAAMTIVAGTPTASSRRRAL